MSYCLADHRTQTVKIYVSNENDNVIIGHNSYDALVQNYKNCNVVGNNIECSGNNQVQLGNSLSNVYSQSGIQNTSDSRDKTQIRDTVLGLDFISQLRPVDFKWNFRSDYNTPTDEYHIVNGVRVPVVDVVDNDGSKTRNRFHHGLVAQEVKQLMDTMGVDFGGYQDHNINGGKDQLTISYTELIAPMIKSMQELKLENDLLKQDIAELKQDIAELKTKI